MIKINKINKGKKKNQYILCLKRRGCVNRKHTDLVVKHNRKYITKLGHLRKFGNNDVLWFKLFNYNSIILSDYKYTNAFYRYLVKLIYSFK